LYLIILASNVDKSSSERCPFGCLTDGRIDGGGIGNIVYIIHSGRENLGSKPINLQSSSVIFCNILRHFTGSNNSIYLLELLTPISEYLDSILFSMIPSCLTASMPLNSD